MNRLKPFALRSLLDLLYVGRAHQLLGPRSRGVGAIFTLHHVRPAQQVDAFAPNRILDISPQFLEQCIELVRELDYDIVTLDEAAARLQAGGRSRRFVCFTLDDGYTDNLEFAAPVFERLDAPFTVYVTTGLADGTTVMWWEHLEDIVRQHDRVRVTIGTETLALNCRSTREKYWAFGKIYWQLRAVSHATQQAAVRAMLDDYSIQAETHSRKAAMTWEQLGALAARPHATIGVHTIHHHALAKLTAEDVRDEAERSRQLIAERLRCEARHFCYPFGDAASAGPREFELIRELGFTTATTTRKGVLYADHVGHLHALPRVSLNGDYQRARYVKLFLSGAPFALQNRFRQLDVA